MSKVAAKRFSYPRPQNNFQVDSVALLIDIARRHEKAGFPAIPAVVTIRRYWQYLSFLQRHGFTTRIVAASMKDVSVATELRNSDLTDDGFRFVQYSHDKWLDRIYRDTGELREERMLERWLAKFTSLRSPDNSLQPSAQKCGG